MRILTRHFLLALLPIACGVAAGWAVAQLQAGCSSLVGPLFAAKCGRIKAEYQLEVQTGVTAGIALLTATIGALLEWRRERRGRAATAPAPSSPPAT